MHVFLTREGYVPHKSMDGKYSEERVYRWKSNFFSFHQSFLIYTEINFTAFAAGLNRYKKRIIKKTQNLLTGKTEVDPDLLKRAETHGHTEIISSWHPNITINLVADQTPWTKGKVPQPLDTSKYELILIFHKDKKGPICFEGGGNHYHKLSIIHELAECRILAQVCLY